MGSLPVFFLLRHIFYRNQLPSSLQKAEDSHTILNDVNTHFTGRSFIQSLEKTLKYSLTL